MLSDQYAIEPAFLEVPAIIIDDQEYRVIGRKFYMVLQAYSPLDVKMVLS